MSFVGDDFTGSTDALESLTLAGVRTVLFSAVPTSRQLADYPGLQAFGVATTARALSPDAMAKTLRPILSELRQLAPIVHYKVCSTFDSAPQVGSIGRAIEIGRGVFDERFVPILVGAPDLGRHCVFGNLFARVGTQREPIRLDRHPSMSRHPVTPMREADLRLHLAAQTSLPIGLFDLLGLEAADAVARFDAFRAETPAGVIDLLYSWQLPRVGGLIDRCEKPLFIVGSSGVESALCAHWQASGRLRAATPMNPPGAVGPIVVISGSCSPVTLRQIEHAGAHGFRSIALSSDMTSLRNAACAGTNLIVHSDAAQHVESGSAQKISAGLAASLREVLSLRPYKRVLIAGGDTSGAVAGALGIQSMEMIALLTRGAPLVRVAADGSPADGLEMVFKGGQIGPVDFFSFVQGGG